MTARIQAFHRPTLGKIILVEDDELFSAALKKDLDRLKVSYKHTTNFDEAHTLVKEQEVYHALVTDIFIQSNKPNGLELVSLARDQGLPSVIITSALDLSIAKEGTNNGADYILEKPFEAKKLTSVLEEIWENPRGLLGRRERCFDHHNLTPKERDFARLMLKGLSNKEIADVLETTVSTVKFYSNQIFEKCEVGSRGEFFNLVFPT